METIYYPEHGRWVAWGYQACSAPHCERYAQALLDGEPYCIECADDLFERTCAIDLRPKLRETLPPPPGWEA